MKLLKQVLLHLLYWWRHQPQTCCDCGNWTWSGLAHWGEPAGSRCPRCIEAQVAQMQLSARELLTEAVQLAEERLDMPWSSRGQLLDSWKMLDDVDDAVEGSGVKTPLDRQRIQHLLRSLLEEARVA